MNRKCPSCGKNEEKNEFIKEFCSGCFVRHFELGQLPPEVIIVRCTVCGRVKKENDWIEENKTSLSGIIKSKFKSAYVFSFFNVALKQSRKGFTVLLDVEFQVDGKKVTKQFSTQLVFEQTQCIDCSRDTGGYYDSIVQFRLLDGVQRGQWQEAIAKLEPKLKKFVKALERHGGRLHKVEETETGFDLYTAGITPSMQASHALCDNVKHTRKLIGRKKGKDLYRHTFCLRF